jgi:drug/metabolite transporter (DMT)-like permease
VSESDNLPPVIQPVFTRGSPPLSTSTSSTSSTSISSSASSSTSSSLRSAGPTRLRVMLAFAAIYIIWGSTYLGIRVAVAHIPPFLMAGCRYVLAGGILFACLRAMGVATPTVREWRHALLGGFLMLTIGNGLVSWAELSVPSNLAALLVAAVPLYTALFDWCRPGGQRPPRSVLLGITVGFAGMLLLALPERGSIATPHVAGVVAILIAGMGWALGTLYARYGRHHPHSLMASAQLMITGGGLLLLVALARGEATGFSPAAISAKSGLAFAYLTVVGSLVAFSAYSWLVAVSTPALISTTAYVNPVVAVILGWLLLDERLSSRALGGAALIIGAVVVMTVGSGSSARVRGWLRRRSELGAVRPPRP